MKNLLRAASLAIVILTMGVAVPAFAAGSTVTTTTVVASKPSIYSGQAEVFRATVAPTKVGMTKITGSITWTVTGPAITLLSITGNNDGMNYTFDLTFANPTIEGPSSGKSDAVFGFINLDTDKNAATGVTGRSAGSSR